MTPVTAVGTDHDNPTLPISLFHPQAPTATIADIMRPSLATASQHDYLAAAAYLMKHTGTTALLVADAPTVSRPASSRRRVPGVDRRRRGDNQVAPCGRVVAIDVAEPRHDVHSLGCGVYEQ